MWALEGYDALVTRALHAPKSSVAIHQEITEQLSPILAFARERLDVSGGTDDMVAQTRLHSLYLAWCAENNIRVTPTRHKFTSMVEGAFGSQVKRAQRRNGAGARVWVWVGLNVVDREDTL